MFCSGNYNNIYYKTYKCHENISPIYFDHQIGNGISTFQKLIYFGNHYKGTIITPLIKKCIQNS
jgi:hypothetical protein